MTERNGKVCNSFYLPVQRLSAPHFQRVVKAFHILCVTLPAVLFLTGGCWFLTSGYVGLPFVEFFCRKSQGEVAFYRQTAKCSICNVCKSIENPYICMVGVMYTLLFPTSPYRGRQRMVANVSVCMLHSLRQIMLSLLTQSFFSR